jgi:molecular chaperone GrpE
MSVATADAAPGTVVEEQQRGFYLHERLIRPAAVVVAAAPPARAVEGQAGVDEAGSEVAGATGGAPGPDRS